MAGLNADQEKEVTFISGVTAQGTVAATSFWTWNQDSPATYDPINSNQSKWGATQAGTGATITVGFTASSNWTSTEKAAFQAALDLWSAEANVKFTITNIWSTANVQLVRASDGTASGGNYSNLVAVGSSELGHAITGEVDIDTSVAGFGPIGSSFTVAGGYPWQTIEHELGHVLGLGHGGAYNDGTTTNSPQFTQYDNTAYSIMSYNEAPDYSSSFMWGNSGGYHRSPVTPMMFDIVAMQRLYGAPVGGPLSGGQVFGFHTNITTDIAQFFDFTINSRPVVTLYDSGANNTLDLSGFTIGATVDLHPGTFSSVAGLINNIGIALDTKIDTLVGSSAGDKIVGNDDSDVLQGGGGGDTISGGVGNDHIYGNMLTTTQGTTDGADVIDTGGGSNYVNGNAGNDTITASSGSNRLYGGQGDDMIHVTGNGTNHLNGNLGDDTLIVDGGNNEIHGGQGNDVIQANGGNNLSFGEIGNDVIWVGSGFDKMTGGPGSDLFVLTGNANAAGVGWDEIVDFTHGTDELHMNANGGLPTILHAANGFADEASAAAYAHLALGNATGEVAALQVGSDTYLFYAISAGIEGVVKLDGITAGTIDQSDFVTGTSHL